MDAVELLRKMDGACKVKCYCWLTLDDDAILVLRWSGDIKVDKDGDKKEWRMEVRITPYQLRQPNYLDMRLIDAERRIALLHKGIAEGVEG